MRPSLSFDYDGHAHLTMEREASNPDANADILVHERNGQYTVEVAAGEPELEPGEHDHYVRIAADALANYDGAPLETPSCGWGDGGHHSSGWGREVK